MNFDPISVIYKLSPIKHLDSPFPQFLLQAMTPLNTK